MGLIQIMTELKEEKNMSSIDGLKRKIEELKKRLPQPEVRIRTYWGNEEKPPVPAGTQHIVTKWGTELNDMVGREPYE
jgi:hypothetical protein